MWGQHGLELNHFHRTSVRMEMFSISAVHCGSHWSLGAVEYDIPQRCSRSRPPQWNEYPCIVSHLHVWIPSACKSHAYTMLECVKYVIALYLKKKKKKQFAYLNLKITKKNTKHLSLQWVIVVTEHRSPQQIHNNNEKVLTVAKITKVWQRHIKWANAIGKIVLIDLLINTRFTQTFNLF